MKKLNFQQKIIALFATLLFSISLATQVWSQGSNGVFEKPAFLGDPIETVHRRSSTYLLTAENLKKKNFEKLIEYYRASNFYSIRLDQIRYDFGANADGRRKGDSLMVSMNGCLIDHKGPKSFATSSAQIEPVQMIIVRIFAPGKPTKRTPDELAPYDGYELNAENMKKASGRVEIETLYVCQRP